GVSVCLPDWAFGVGSWRLELLCLPICFRLFGCCHDAGRFKCLLVCIFILSLSSPPATGCVQGVPPAFCLIFLFYCMPYLCCLPMSSVSGLRPCSCCLHLPKTTSKG
ncbi:unnamed protein product, partial [Ectocarpus fasciculatus]